MSQNQPKLPLPSLFTSANNWDGVYLQYDRQPTFELPEHTHERHTLIIGTDNKLNAEWSIDGQFKTLQYNKGDVFVIPAGVPHKAYWKQESEGIMLAIEPKTIANAATDSLYKEPLELLPKFAAADLCLLQIAQWLLIELQQNQIGSSLYIESLIAMVKIHLLRNYCTVKQHIPNYSGGLAQHKLKKAIAFMHEHLDGDLKLTEIANLVTMSPYHFARMFKQSTGFAPHQYLVQQRIIKAKELLRYSNLAIADIGYEVGYKNPSHFARVFRQHTQVSPKAYRDIFN